MNRFRKSILRSWFCQTTAACILTAVSVASFAGPVDPHFHVQVASGGGTLSAGVELSDGKILVAGGFQMVDGINRPALVRLHADGTLDDSFTFNGTLPFGEANLGKLLLARQSDNSTIICAIEQSAPGPFSSFTSTLLKIRPTGEIDTTFGTITVAGRISCLAVQSDDAILISGGFLEVGTTARKGIARLSSKGDVDQGFDPGPGFEMGPEYAGSAWISFILPQPDGKLLMSGRFSKVHGAPRNGVVRLHADGSLDESLVPIDLEHQPFPPLIITAIRPPPATISGGSGSYFNIRSLALDSNGKIIVGINPIGSGSGAELQYGRVARLLPDGSLDTTFQSPISGYASSIFPQPDGTILVVSGESFYTPGQAAPAKVARLLPDGEVDPSYLWGGAGFPSARDHSSIELAQPGGKVIVGSCRLKADGTQDETFPIFGQAGEVWSALPLDGGESLVAGAFHLINGVRRTALALLRADATVDLSFRPELAYSTSVTDLIRQPDGKILVSGTTLTDFHELAVILRLRPDGTADPTFTKFPPEVNTSFSEAYIYSILTPLLTPDGKILLRAFVRDDETLNTKLLLIRLNSDGSEDKSFHPPANLGLTSPGLLPGFFLLSLQSDGKAVVASGGKMARLNMDGSIDSSFQAPVVNLSIKTLKIAPDDKVLISGSFNRVDGVPRANLARLQRDGSLDPSFYSGTVQEDSIEAVAPLADGRILIGGHFDHFASRPRNGLAALNADGSIDLSFNLSLEAGTRIAKIHASADGSILLQGSFSKIGGFPVTNLARIYLASNQVRPVFTLPALTSGGPVNLTLKGEPDRPYTIESSSDLVHWKQVASKQETNGIIPLGFSSADFPQLFFRSKDTNGEP